MTRSRSKSAKRAKCSAFKAFMIEIAPVLVFVIFSALFALFYHLIENGSQNMYSGSTIANTTYWDALFLINTLHSTIGFGSISPQTHWSRLLSVIYALLVIPLMLITLDRIGKWLFLLIKWFLTQMFGEVYGNQSNFLCGIVLVVVWILSSALIFSAFGLVYTQNGYRYYDESYASSLYFTLISLTTIGLGDLVFYDNTFVIVHFTVIFIGLSMVSMCIQMFQQKIEQFCENITNRINKAYQESLSRSDSQPHMSNDKSQAKFNIRNFYKTDRQSRFVSLFLAKSKEKKLVDIYQLKANMKNSSSQYERSSRDFSTQTGVSKFSSTAGSQTGDKPQPKKSEKPNVPD